MLKKSMVLFLSLLLVFSCLPVTNVFAAAVEKGTYTEDCEDGALSAPFTNWGDYAVAEGVGKGGSKGLVGHRSYAYVEFENAMTTDDIAVITYDFKVSALPTGVAADTTFLNLGQWPHNGSVGIQAKYYVATGKADFVCGASTVAVDTSAWYRIVIFKESSNAGSGKVYLLDDNGSLLLSKTNLWMEPINTGYDRFTAFNISVGAEAGAELVVDNLTLDYIDQAANGPALKESSVANNAEGVAQNLKSINIKVDQPLTTMAATLTPEGGEAITCTVAAGVTPLDYVVSWTADLAYSTPYTLNISGSKNRLNTAATGTVIFETEEKPVIIHNISVVENFEDGSLDATNFQNTLSAATVVDGIGKDGGKGLKIGANSTGKLMTQNFSMVEGDQAALSFDFMLTKDAAAATSNTKLFHLAHSSAVGGRMITVEKDSGTSAGFKLAGGSFDEVKLNTWYHVGVAKAGSGTTADEQYFYYYSDETVDTKRTRTTEYHTNFAFEILNVITATGAEAVIDNIAYSLKTKTTYGPALASSSIANGANNVPASAKSMTVQFDAPFTCKNNTWVYGPSGVTMKASDGTNIPVTITPVSNYFTAMDFKVTWTADLAKDETYTLDFSGAKNLAGAAATGTVTFTTEEPSFEDKVLRDSFEVSSYFTTYPGQYGDKYNGSSFLAAWNYYNRAGVNQTDGYTGKAAKISKAGCTSRLTGLFSRPVTNIEENEKLVLNFRMKIKDATDVVYDEETGTYSMGNKVKFGISGSGGNSPGVSQTMFWINTDIYTGENYIGAYLSDFNGVSTAGRNGYYYDENQWYNVYWTVAQSEMNYAIVDASTGELVYQGNNTGDYSGDIVFILGEMEIYPIGGGTTYDGYNNGTEIYIDDVALWTIDNTDGCKAKITSTLPEGEVIDKNNDTVGITFNQPMLPARTQIEIYEGDDCTVNTGKTPYVLYPDFKEIVLDFSGLEYASDYTADLGGIISAGGAGMSDTSAVLSFVTEEDGNNDVSIIGDVSANFNNGSLTDTTVSMKLNNNTENTMEGVQLLAAVYGNNGTLLGVEKSEPLTLVPGRNDGTIAFEKDYVDACKVKVFTWSGLTTLMPLGETEEAWGGATEVLFIGNSLSEDASQYLHLMAQADGNEKFNLTVAAVGGAGLKHHARNLKQELENPDYVTEGGTVRDRYFGYVNGEYTNKWLKLTDFLAEKQYDVIAIQDYGNGIEDYNYDLINVTYMVNTLKQLQPNARIMLYETWSQNSSRGATYTYRIAPWYKAASEALDVEIIPSGRAFNLAQLSDAEGEGFNTAAPTVGNTDPEAQTGVGIADALGMYRDTDHASYYGRYLTDAVIYEAITGNRVNASFAVPTPNGVDAATHAANLAELRDFAHQAVLEFN